MSCTSLIYKKAVSKRRTEERRYLVFTLHKKRSNPGKGVCTEHWLFRQPTVEYFALHDQPNVCILLAPSNLAFIFQVDVPTFLSLFNGLP